MKAIVFDASTIISLASNNLLWILEPLKKRYKGKFLIPSIVKDEIITEPLHSLRFKFSAMQVAAEVAKGTLEIYDSKNLQVQTKRLLGAMNNLFLAKRRFMRLLSAGEVSVLALAREVGADCVAIDERTMRLLIEDPYKLARLQAEKLHTKVDLHQRNLDIVLEATHGFQVMRSSELAVIAYEMGLLNQYVHAKEKRLIAGNLQKNLLEGLLWALKLNGFSISGDEIANLVKIEGFTTL